MNADRQFSEVLKRIHDAVIDQSYVVTRHALLEMENDHLDILDVESALLTGTIEQVFENDPRGLRFEVVGTACDLTTQVGVVLRFVGPLLVITAYEMNR